MRIDGIAGQVFLIVPVVILVLVIWWATRRKPTADRASLRADTGRYGLILQRSDVGPEDGANAELANDQRFERPQRDKQTLIDEISIAKSNGHEHDLARLHLDLARLEITAGSRATASENLRNSILIAAKCDLKSVHAAARLELGDLAREDGDLTTACEHWQMARSLYHDIDSKQAFAQVVQRMRSNGCPTDWVLNDF